MSFPPGCRLHILCCLMLMLLFPWFCRGEDSGPQKPSRQDKCPVCGMFVYKYPDWVSEIIFKDGKTVFFDGPKDLFKYLLNLKKYDPARNPEDIAAIYVSEYYNVRLIRAEAGLFVIGSDVYGPMGREVIPLGTREDAVDFLKDHRGKAILRFPEVTPKVIEGLD